MGIRFICPECEKRIHVKSFLAGRRGICPKCGGKVQIPTESEAGDSSKQEAGPPVPPGGYATASAANSQGSARQDSVTAAAPVNQASLAQVSIPAGLPSAGQPSSTPQSPTQPGDGSNGSQAMPSRPIGPVPVSPAPITPAAGQPTGQAADPLTEAPQAKWYVRPPSGGQFGPAAADSMRKWLTEGRVSADSLVWREGWADWRKSSEVFPELGSTPAVPSAPIAPATPAEFPISTPTSSARPYRRKKSSSGLAMGMVVSLALLAIGLLVAFVVVIQQ